MGGALCGDLSSVFSHGEFVSCGNNAKRDGMTRWPTEMVSALKASAEFYRADALSMSSSMRMDHFFSSGPNARVACARLRAHRSRVAFDG